MRLLKLINWPAGLWSVCECWECLQLVITLCWCRTLNTISVSHRCVGSGVFTWVILLNIHSFFNWLRILWQARLAKAILLRQILYMVCCNAWWCGLECFETAYHMCHWVIVVKQQNVNCIYTFSKQTWKQRTVVVTVDQNLNFLLPHCTWCLDKRKPHCWFHKRQIIATDKVEWVINISYPTSWFVVVEL